MKYDLYAVHRKWLACSTQSLTCVQHIACHIQIYLIKMKNTHTSEYQLRSELYGTFFYGQNMVPL